MRLSEWLPEVLKELRAMRHAFERLAAILEGRAPTEVTKMPKRAAKPAVVRKDKKFIPNDLDRQRAREALRRLGFRPGGKRGQT